MYKSNINFKIDFVAFTFLLFTLLITVLHVNLLLIFIGYGIEFMFVINTILFATYTV